MMMVIGVGNVYAADKWVKTDPTALVTGDVVMIVDQGSNRAMSNDKGTSNPPDAIYIYYTDDNKTESTGTKNNTVPANLQWVVTVNNDSYKFGVSETSKYLYCTNGNNGVRVGTNSNNAFTIEKISGKSYLKNTATSRYLGVYTTNYDWRCYDSTTGNINNTVTAFYKKVESSTPSGAALTEISISGYTTEFTVGDKFEFGGTVMATYDDESTMDVTGKADFSGYDMSKEGDQTVTVSYTEGEETKSATYDITVNALEGDLYTLVTDVEDLKAGDKVIIVNIEYNKAMSTTQNSNNRSAVDVSIGEGNADALVPNSSGIQVFTLEGDAEGWYFNTGSGYIYAASNEKNYLRTQTTQDDNAKAEITISGDETSVVFQGTNSHNILQYNNSNTLFSCYGSASQKPVSIFVLKDEKQDAELSFSEESVTVDLGEIEDFVSPTFNNPNNLTVTATSTNENVAVFDVETGKIVINGSEGTAEITVTSAATDEFRVGKASITVTVKKAETSVYFTEPIVEITYGDNYDKQKATAEGFSGNLVYTSSDESVVKFHGNNVIDVLGPGTVTITATAPATETTSESSATYTLKIYEPADAVEGAAEAINEDFSKCEGTNTSWGGSSGFANVPADLGWETSYCQAGPGYLKLGNTSNAGVATSPVFSVVGEAPLSFALAPWVANNSTEDAKVIVTLSNATFANRESSIEVSTKDLTQREFTSFDQYKIVGNSEAVQITFSANGGYNRYFLDNVVVGGGAQPAHEINLTFSSAGYLTWVATADIDFSQTAGVTAYKITEATPKKITMVEVDKVKTGEAVMLKGSGTVQLTRTTGVEAFTDNKMQACTDGSVTGNGVGGVTNTDVYVLGNGKNGLGFYMLKGTLQAGKGYLSVTEEAGNAKQSFIGFEVVTGLDAVEAKDADDAAIYNLQGIRVAHPQKGIYVKNGKKYVK